MVDEGWPNCKNFYNATCCVFSPDCPSGMTDIGISCAKDSYGRTAGIPLTCKPDKKYDTGLCYTPCEHDADGKGLVCWGKCPKDTKE